MREKWKAFTKRERRLFAAALVFLALAVLLRFVPGLRFSALLCLCAAAVLFVLFVLECAARRGSRAAVWGRRVLLALLAAGFVLFAALETMVIRGSLAEKTDEPVSAVIVLGAGVNGETPSLTLRTRIDAAAAYLEEHPDVPVVLSGGQGPGEAITEAECMRRALVRRGVDESRLYPEERSTSTQENLRYSRAILEELGVDRHLGLPPLPRAADVGRRYRRRAGASAFRALLSMPDRQLLYPRGLRPCRLFCLRRLTMNKDILCLYYSRTGHTKFAMEEIAAALDCECVEMRDRVNRDGAIGWLRCGLDAMRRRTRAMEPFDTRRALQDYRLVILGTPIWAGRCSSIARGFLKRRGLEVQNIAYVVVHGSEELYKDVCDQMDQYVDHPHVADVSLRIGSAGYHFWRDEFIRNVTNYMTAEN